MELDGLFDRPVTATLCTVGPDGAPHAAPVWFVRDGDDVLVSTFAGTQKHRNIEREARVSLSIVDPDDPMAYAEVRGIAAIEPDPDKTLPDRVVQAHGYDDAAAFDRPGIDRIVVRIHPERTLGRTRR